MAQRSTIKGAASFRRMLKMLPDDANKRLVTFLQAAGPPLAEKMKSELPVLKVPRPDRTAGALRNSISWRVTPTTLNLKVGTLNAKLGRSSLFYGHILDVGRKGKTVPITRGPRAGGKMKIRVLAGLYVINRLTVSFQLDSLPGYRTIIDDILLTASKGAGDD